MQRLFSFTRSVLTTVVNIAPIPMSIKSVVLNRVLAERVVVAFTTQEAKVIYGAISDIAQLLKHVNSYATDELLLKRVRELSKCHGNTLYDLSEGKLFDALPKEIQTEVEKHIDFCN